jgi:DNA-binding XRE family transcriptional regulator
MVSTMIARPKRRRTKERMEFGDRLRTRRINCGLTQQELGESVGVSRAHISTMEDGQGWPSVELLRKIARSLRITMDDLAGES